MTEIKKFIQYLIADIDLLKNVIQKDDLEILKKIKKDKQMLDIKENYFTNLINRYCFNPFPSDYNYIKGYEESHLFLEVPIMLLLVYLGRYLDKRDFWKSDGVEPTIVK